MINNTIDKFQKFEESDKDSAAYFEAPDGEKIFQNSDGSARRLTDVEIQNNLDKL
jgi:hypothetical protein